MAKLARREAGAPEVVPITPVTPGKRFDRRAVRRRVRARLAFDTRIQRARHPQRSASSSTPATGSSTHPMRRRDRRERLPGARPGRRAGARLRLHQRLREGRSPSEARWRTAGADDRGGAAASPSRPSRRMSAPASRCRRRAQGRTGGGRRRPRDPTLVDVAGGTRLARGTAAVLEQDAYGYLPRNKVVALVTGSQGEPRAALARIARDEQPGVVPRGRPRDLSSRAIPGNESANDRIINGLVDRGVEVDHDANQAGPRLGSSPAGGTRARCIDWIKPSIAVPVHGEAVHLEAHAARRAAAWHPQRRPCPQRRHVSGSPRGRPRSSTTCRPAGSTGTATSLIGTSDRARRRSGAGSSFAGLVSVAIAIDERGEIAGDPVVDADRAARCKTRDGRADRRTLVADAVGRRARSGCRRPKRRDAEARARRAVAPRPVRGPGRRGLGKKPAVPRLRGATSG